MTDKIRQAAEECAQEVFNAGPEWPAVKRVTPIIAFHMRKLVPSESPTSASEEELVAALAKQMHHHLSAAQNLAWEEGDTCGDCADDVRDICMPIIRAYAAERVREAERQEREGCAKICDDYGEIKRMKGSKERESAAHNLAIAIREAKR